MGLDPRLTETSGTQPPGSRRLFIAGAMLSHPGFVRTSNEDRVIYRLPGKDDPDAAFGALALVADGMGGHAAGEVASAIAAESIHYLFYRRPQLVPDALAEAFAAANLAIHQRGSSDADCAGMGTTCTVVVLRDNQAWLGHVGDSRAYLIRGAAIHQISDDHSLVAELVRKGDLTDDEAKVFPDRNVILRALGIRPTVEPTIWSEGLPLLAGDIFVLCSDGLSDLVDDETIRRLAGSLAPLEACQALIDAALQAGGHDNVSVGVIAVDAVAAQPDRMERSTRRIDLTLRQEASA